MFDPSYFVMALTFKSFSTHLINRNDGMKVDSGQKIQKNKRNTQRAEARCYPKKKVPKKTLQIQKI